MLKIQPETGTKIVVQHGQSSGARTVRETIESIVIAFILAFLFRTFEAEAFVIPTGSMAPTLQGRHKDVDCPKCGYRYRVSASDEVDESGKLGECHVNATTCPMCRYTLDVDADGGKDFPSYNGDRIIVSKFAYDLEDPHRWDVVVFKYPEDSKTNYIKRLIGLPNERIRILNGDIHTAPLGSDEFQIARKPAEKVRHMLQPVFNNDYVVPELLAAGMPQRWQPWATVPGASPWKAGEDFKSFEVPSAAGPPAWLRYQNILPTYDIWADVLSGKRFTPPAASPIEDFYAYNDGQMNCGRGFRDDVDHWVGDLALDLELSVINNSGAVALELVKAGRQFRCTIDVATGQATLGIGGKPDFAPTAATSIRGPGTHQVSFANVDEQLFLWVDGKSIEFNGPTTFERLQNSAPVMDVPVPGSDRATDLSPVGIAVEGGAAVRVSHLNISRDVYYTADPGGNSGPFIVGKDQSQILDLQADQYFMLGDNSPRSKDSRYWNVQHFVDRKLLIGKALFVYWPHSFNYVEVGGKKIPLPFWPNFGRMRFVH